MKKKNNDGFIPTPIKFSPEVVAARKAYRKKELNKTLEERVKELQRERRERNMEYLKEGIKEHKWQIIGTYGFLFLVLVGAPLIAQLFS